MRKFGCLLLAVLILVIFVLPASISVSAAEVTNDHIYDVGGHISPLKFDCIADSSGNSFPWVLNSVEPGVRNQNFTITPGYAGYYDSNSDATVVNAVFYPGTGSGDLGIDGQFRLIANFAQFVRMRQLRSFKLSNEFEGCRISYVDISFNLLTVSGSSSAELIKIPLSSRYYPSDTDDYRICAVGEWISEMIIRQVGDSSYALISDLCLTVPYVRDGTSVAAFAVDFNASYTDGYIPISWFQSFGLYRDSSFESTDFFGFLINAVEGFLDFEIAPGLSINKILYVILVIGVILWFITLLI